MDSNNSKSPAPRSWDSRTRFVVFGQVFLFLLVWVNAMGRLIGTKFWDRQYNIEQFNKILSNEETPNILKHGINHIFMSYFTNRYIWFFPHVAGSIIWWNLYFLQLIPSIRQRYKKFHRVLGRILMICALAQTISGVGLAYMNKSSTIKLLSYLLAIAVVYCTFYAWYFAAIAKDIPKHKYWSMRLVGYLQIIALQRLCMGLLFVCFRFGMMGLYPPFDEDDTGTLAQIFDDSFVCSFITGFLLTEWYLAGYYEWTKTPIDGQEKVKTTSNSNSSKSPTRGLWDSRTRFVVFGQVFLFLLVWVNAMGRLIGTKFWDRQYNLEQLNEMLSSEETPNMVKHGINLVSMSYFTNRYIWFFPHVAGSIIWWNLYFLQLIPSIRQRYKKFHRVLGRILMICALAQTISGVGLAYMNKSSTIKLISYLLAIAVIYCAFYAWYFAAIAKDIPKHKYWSMRLVGYLQTIALQRLFMGLLIVCFRFGMMGLYPPFDEDDKGTLVKIFDDSFVCCFVTAILLTEWYLAGYYGWTEIPIAGQEKAKTV